MDNVELIGLWKTQEEKIEKSLAINKWLLNETINQKVQSTLRSLIWSKAIGIVIAIVYLIILGSVLFIAISHYSSVKNYFIISFGAIFLINVKAVYDYIKHLVLATNIDYNGNVTTIQEQLTQLQLSIAQHSRTMFLQLPFWTTFFLSSKWFPSHTNWIYIILQIIITGSFCWLAIYLYKNLTINNLDKKWVKSILSGAGGKQVMNAMNFYKEIEAFKNETYIN